MSPACLQTSLWSDRCAFVIYIIEECQGVGRDLILMSSTIDCIVKTWRAIRTNQNDFSDRAYWYYFASFATLGRVSSLFTVNGSPEWPLNADDPALCAV